MSQTIDDFRNFYKTNKELVATTLESVITRALKIINSSLEDQSVKLI